MPTGSFAGYFYHAEGDGDSRWYSIYPGGPANPAAQPPAGRPVVFAPWTWETLELPSPPQMGFPGTDDWPSDAAAGFSYEVPLLWQSTREENLSGSTIQDLAEHLPFTDATSFHVEIWNDPTQAVKIFDSQVDISLTINAMERRNISGFWTDVVTDYSYSETFSTTVVDGKPVVDVLDSLENGWTSEGDGGIGAVSSTLPLTTQWRKYFRSPPYRMEVPRGALLKITYPSVTFGNPFVDGPFVGQSFWLVNATLVPTRLRGPVFYSYRILYEQSLCHDWKNGTYWLLRADESQVPDDAVELKVNRVRTQEALSSVLLSSAVQIDAVGVGDKPGIIMRYGARLLVLGRLGALYVSNDESLTWGFIMAISTGDLRALAAACDAKRGTVYALAVDEDGLVYNVKVRDTGTTPWAKEVVLSTLENLRRPTNMVIAGTDLVVCAATDSGVAVYVSRDEMASWTEA